MIVSLRAALYGRIILARQPSGPRSILRRVGVELGPRGLSGLTSSGARPLRRSAATWKHFASPISDHTCLQRHRYADLPFPAQKGKSCPSIALKNGQSLSLTRQFLLRNIRPHRRASNEDKKIFVGLSMTRRQSGRTDILPDRPPRRGLASSEPTHPPIRLTCLRPRRSDDPCATAEDEPDAKRPVPAGPPFLLFGAASPVPCRSSTPGPGAIAERGRELHGEAGPAPIRKRSASRRTGKVKWHGPLAPYAASLALAGLSFDVTSTTSSSRTERGPAAGQLSNSAYYLLSLDADLGKLAGVPGGWLHITQTFFGLRWKTTATWAPISATPRSATSRPSTATSPASRSSPTSSACSTTASPSRSGARTRTATTRCRRANRA